MEIKFVKADKLKAKPQPGDKLGFGHIFTDYMLVMPYDEGQGWHDGRIVPHEPFLIEPASCVLHYAQMMFEGMKAYLRPDGEIPIFRPDMNAKRMARTAERMVIPELPEEIFLCLNGKSLEKHLTISGYKSIIGCCVLQKQKHSTPFNCSQYSIPPGKNQPHCKSF